jgi:fatty acid desaturase
MRRGKTRTLEGTSTRIMDATVASMRFLFGAIAGLVLVAFLAIWGFVPLWLGISLPVAVGVLATFFGDRFIVGFMRIFRWLR